MISLEDKAERALAIALLASLVLWNLPFGGLVAYPFKLLATWVHEMSHGVVMIVTGAGLSHVDIYRDTSGLAFAQNGTGGIARAAISAAGYMGAPVIGAIMLVVGQSHRNARFLLAAIATLLGVTALIFVRNDYGIFAIIACAVCLGVLAAVANETISVLAINFIAAQTCINAVLDVRVLFRTNLVVNGSVIGSSDAHSMAMATFGTNGTNAVWFWATAWMLWSLLAFYFALRLIHRRKSRRATTEPSLGGAAS